MALIAAASKSAGQVSWFPHATMAYFTWCLQNDPQLVHQMTHMSIGLYNEPMGAYLPSVLY